MTWRLKLAEWLVKDLPYSVVSTEVVLAHVRLVAEEKKVETLVERHPHLQPTFEILRPSKQKRERLH